MALKGLALNSALVIVATAISLAVCELAARTVLRPADYLSVEMVMDEALGAVPSPHTRAGGLDEWGFRNRAVPKSADIVAIGDSHTYGNTATMADSWPAVLERLSGRSVYNLGLGGYGPNQYLELLKRRAIELKPRTIVCGLYMGDDFENAYLITYGLDHWAYLRRLSQGQTDFNIWQQAAAPSTQKRIRLWLSRHSVVYQLVVHGPLLGRFQGEAQIDRAPELYNGTVLAVPEKGILEAFRPQEIFRNLDQQSPMVREGMRITFELLREMDEICRQNHIQFVVAVIPTKESVFADYFEHDPTLRLSELVNRLIVNERLARERLFDFMTASHIASVDTLPALRAAVGQHLYARTAADMHPGANGYRVIAQAIDLSLKGTPRDVAGNR